MEEELKSIFDQFKSKNKVETAHFKYIGNKKTYIVWTIISDIPIFSSEDEITYSEVSVDIDIYSDSNYLKIMSRIKKIMNENEWFWDGDSAETFEEDTGLYHKTITYKKERYLNG